MDIDLSLSPTLAIPIENYQPRIFTVGGGIALSAGIRLFNMVSPVMDGGYLFVPLNQTNTALQLVFAGAGVNGYLYPVSRLELALGAKGGLYEAIYKNDTFINTWWRMGLEAGFRVSPLITVSANGGYIQFNQGQAEPLYTGVTTGITAHFNIETKRSEGSITVGFEQTEPVFPLFSGIYKTNSIGSLTIINGESAEIRDVRVSFRAGNYTVSLIECGSTPLLRKNRSLTIPLYADFSNLILNFTENGKIPGEVIIEYTLLGSKRLVTQTTVLSVHNRNAIRWSDTAAIAAFIAPTSAEVLDLSKYLVGIARDKLRSGLNRNMQFSMYLLEGLIEGGLSLSTDDSTPYVSYHTNSEFLDYVQYPFQTLAFKSGDLDDIGLLYAALLESVGISAAIIPLSDDFIVAYSLGIDFEAAESLFNSTDSLLDIGGEVWMPLSMATLKEGYVNCWNRGMDRLGQALNSGEQVDFVLLSEAWQNYPPAAFIAGEATFAKPAESRVIRKVETALSRYIAVEFAPKIKAIQAQISAQGGTTSLYNSLGLLYVRAGLYTEAKAEFAKSATMGSVAAMNNLGNIALLERNFTQAKSWFEKALSVQSDNRTALSGLERAMTELDE